MFGMQTVLIVDTLTWTLLWPMLKRNPDQEKLAFFAHQLFNFTSYNQVTSTARQAGMAAVTQEAIGLSAMLH